MDWQKASAELSRKLDPAHVRPPSKFGPKGDYLEGWHCIAEANRIFGFGGWSYTLLDCRCVSERDRPIGREAKPGFGVTYTATVRVAVDGVTRDDVGAGHGYDVDCGLAHESAIKEAVTDALKRSLRTFGNPFGLALYDKTRAEVGVDASPDELAEAIGIINSAPDVGAMTEAWKRMPDPVRNAPGVIEAAKARKAQLTEQKDAA